MVIMALLVERIGLLGSPGVCLRATEALLGISSAGERKDTEFSQGTVKGIKVFYVYAQRLCKDRRDTLLSTGAGLVKASLQADVSLLG